MSVRHEGPTFRFTADRLGGAFDLLAACRSPGVFFERRGAGVAGAIGIPSVTLGTEPFDVVEILGRLEMRRHDVAPVAIGALGFDPDVRHLHELVIPRRAVRRGADGRTWRIESRESVWLPLQEIGMEWLLFLTGRFPFGISAQLDEPEYPY